MNRVNKLLVLVGAEVRRHTSPAIAPTSRRSE